MPESLPSRVEFETISEIPLSVIAPIGISSFVEEIQKSTQTGRKYPLLFLKPGPRGIAPTLGLKDED